ncbi:BON domain protein [Botrimarina colliarenosi]|uniref:BON domain protein n=1 Tax=Botrimarina colliarenosi TaxID=2528001 RepID=A0A5C6AJB8_9BACT|nr:BON domain-containing protein [Botrimarina colliarenosi]TWU00125.1 BON domain protein [Botrimarina colliarenosi]
MVAENAERVIHAAVRRLGQSSHLYLRHIECHVEEDALCLEGKVPSFYLKQAAQSLLQSLEGVERVVNRLEVVNAYGVSPAPQHVTVQKAIATPKRQASPQKQTAV